MANQRVHVDVFDGLTVILVVPIHASPSGGLPDMEPVGGPIASAAKALRIYQRFQQQGTNPVASLPVVRYLAGTQRQDLAGQPFDGYPRQDQKPAIVDDPLQVAFSLRFAPSNPGVSRLHPPGR